jgi:hypothetical protein
MAAIALTMVLAGKRAIAISVQSPLNLSEILRRRASTFLTVLSDRHQKFKAEVYGGDLTNPEFQRLVMLATAE